MLAPLDIFVVAEDGKLLWKGAAENLEVAKSSIKNLMSSAPADYVIYSQRTGNKTTIKADGSMIEPEL